MFQVRPRKGHYGSRCFSKSSAFSSSSRDSAVNSLDTAYLDNLSSDEEHCWVVQVHMCDQETLFNLDTGAEVTAIGEQTYATFSNPTLSSPDKLLHGPSRHALDVLGQFHCDLSHKGNNSKTCVCHQGTQEQPTGTPCHRFFFSNFEGEGKIAYNANDIHIEKQ